MNFSPLQKFSPQKKKKKIRSQKGVETTPFPGSRGGFYATKICSLSECIKPTPWERLAGRFIRPLSSGTPTKLAMDSV